MVMLPVAALCMGTLIAVFVFGTRSFHAVINYTELGAKNRYAANVMLREIREANSISSYNTNSLSIVDGSGVTVAYTYDPNQCTLTRQRNDVSTVLLTGCDRMKFDLGERNPIGGSYAVYPPATAATAKVVDVSWLCSRTILGVKQYSESVQTARIVIRKQGT